MCRAYCAAAAILALFLSYSGKSWAQWNHRYARADWMRHSIYFEGHELPSFCAGPCDPAPSPNGERVAIAAQGWIWILDLHSRVAKRTTRAAGIDSRPRWSPSGNELVFVRDIGKRTFIVRVEIDSGIETVVQDSGTIDLDPSYSVDGQSIIYASAANGDLDLWRHELATGRRTRLTAHAGLERNPRLSADGRHLTYLFADTGLRKQLRELDLATGKERVLQATGRAGLVQHDREPAGSAVVFAWPHGTAWHLQILDDTDPTLVYTLTDIARRPTTPAWSSDGWIYFVEADAANGSRLLRMPAIGGVSEEVGIRSWDWNASTGRLRIETRNEQGDPTSARLAVYDAAGHPLAPWNRLSHFDSATGRLYSYSPGTIEMEVPLGLIHVNAAQGLMSRPADAIVHVEPRTTVTRLSLAPVWDAQASGWASGDHHFHLTYDGAPNLTPNDLLPIMKAEALDVATPLLSNIESRLNDREWWAIEVDAKPRIVKFGQEIRADAYGHVALIGARDLYWPWFWGPPNPSYSSKQHLNLDALSFARLQGGFSSYVHPVSVADPFAPAHRHEVPLELVPDAVLGDVDALELLCLWSNPEGTTRLWYRLLNVGVDIVPIAGTDSFVDFHRGMAIGSVRTYVNLGGSKLSWDTYLAALKQGQSFVTNGPALVFEIGGARPGGLLRPTSGPVPWRIELASASPVKRVELIVNGEVAWSGGGVNSSGQRIYHGKLSLPHGGWIAARAYGGSVGWPGMSSSPYAHTAVVWISTRGSTEPAARAAAARELLDLLASAKESASHDFKSHSRLDERLALAKQRLIGWLSNTSTNSDAP